MEPVASTAVRPRRTRVRSFHCPHFKVCTETARNRTPWLIPRLCNNPMGCRNHATEPMQAGAWGPRGVAGVGLVDLRTATSASEPKPFRAVKRLTVREAIQLTDQEFGPDPVYKSQLVFYPGSGGDHALRIQASQDSTREVSADLLEVA